MEDTGEKNKDGSADASPAALRPPEEMVNAYGQAVRQFTLDANSATAAVMFETKDALTAELRRLRPTRTEDQAWAEISATMSDKMLNPTQKKAFVISILRGQLANPPKFGGYNG